MSSNEKVKKILEANSWEERGYNVMPTDSFDIVAKEICRLFPKSPDNLDKPRPLYEVLEFNEEAVEKNRQAIENGRKEGCFKAVPFTSICINGELLPIPDEI